MENFRTYRSLGTALRAFSSAPKKSAEELFYLKNSLELLNTDQKWLNFYAILEALLQTKEYILLLLGNILIAESRESNNHHLRKGLFYSNGEVFKFYLKMADLIFLPSNKDFWRGLIQPGRPELAKEVMSRLPEEEDIEVLKKFYLICGDQLLVLDRILVQIRNMEDARFLRLHTPEYFTQHLSEIAQKLYFFCPEEAFDYFNDLRKNFEINEEQYGEIEKIRTEIRQIISEKEKSVSLSRLIKLIERYTSASTQTKKGEALGLIFAESSNPNDFLAVLEIAKKNDLGLEFFKTAIDYFFQNHLEGPNLLTVFKAVEGHAIEGYFNGSLINHNPPFEVMKYLHAQSNNQELSQLVFRLMIPAAVHANEFIYLCSQEELDDRLRKKLLAKVRRQHGVISYWITQLGRSKPGSKVAEYAINIIKKDLAHKRFDQAHKIYADNTLNEQISSVLIKILAELANTEEELDKVLYLAGKGSQAFRLAKQKKENL